LRAEMTERFAEAKAERQLLRSEMNQRIERVEQRLDQLSVNMRNWALAAVALVTVVITILDWLFR
ncbi:MAG: hypothetical protein ACE5HA_18770, partial [Anaerolineae bacterium]